MINKFKKLYIERLIFFQKFCELKKFDIFLMISIGIINYGLEFIGLALIIDYLNYFILEDSYFISKLLIYSNIKLEDSKIIVYLSTFIIFFVFFRAVFYFLNIKFKMTKLTQYNSNFLKNIILTFTSHANSATKIPKSIFSNNLLVSSNAIIMGYLFNAIDTFVLIAYTSSILIFFLFFNFKISLIIILLLFFLSVTYKIIILKKYNNLTLLNAFNHKNIGKSLYEIGENIKELLFTNNKINILEDHFTNFNKFANSHARIKNFGAFPKLFIETFFISFVIASLLLVKLFVDTNDGEILKNLLLFTVIGFRFTTLAYNILGGFQNIKQNEAYFNNINNQISLCTEKINFKNSLADIDSLKIDFKHQVSKNKFLKCENLILKKDNLYFVHGENGQGKTTLLEIISGLIPVKSYKLNDKKISSKNIIQYVSYMTQSPMIFNTNILRNIDPEDLIKKKEIIQNMKKLNLNLKKINTKYKDLVNILSGGEKQKITILRSILKNKKILLFDEPTSNLDKKSEIIFYNFIKSINNKIIVIVSHDLSKVNFPYKKIVIENMNIKIKD